MAVSTSWVGKPWRESVRSNHTSRTYSRRHSTTVTVAPAKALKTAWASPTGPPPTTTTSALLLGGLWDPREGQ
eukprot:scaffold8518_cov277-Pinguiococcus_pyrenoidosus.AAC.2